MDKVLNMTFASSLTNLCEVNSSFDTGVLRICYTGENRNKSFFSKEAIVNSIPTIYNCPIVVITIGKLTRLADMTWNSYATEMEF